VIVAAAGNNGAGAEPSYPAAYPGVVAVTAVDHELNVYQRATRGPYVDLAAPGVNVWTASAQGTGSLKTGTSYAVPFVSAAAGVLLASRPDLDITAVRTRLEKATLDLGQPGRDPTFGFGLIQMAGLCSGPAEPPAITTAHEPPLAMPLGGKPLGDLNSVYQITRQEQEATRLLAPHPDASRSCSARGKHQFRCCIRGCPPTAIEQHDCG
jgi:subtilisin family serine protease